MKKFMSVVLVVGIAIGSLSGCGSSAASSTTLAKVSKDEVHNVSVNDAYNAKKMITLDGVEINPKKNEDILCLKEGGFGITYTDNLSELHEEGIIETKTDKNLITLTYVSEKAREHKKNADPEKLKTDEQVLEYLQQTREMSLNLLGVVRKRGVEEFTLKDFKEIYSNVEEVASVGDDTYYIGYNKDYSKFEPNEEEKMILDKLFNGIENFKKGIFVFPAIENEKAFKGNMKEFETTTLTGEEVTQDIFKDKDITMVNIWATWCGPCVEELPELQKLYEMLPENFNLITVCIDGDDDPELAKEILGKFSGEFKVLVADMKLTRNLLSAVNAYPTTVFIDKDGMPIGAAVIGAPSDNTAEAYLDIMNERLKEIGK